MLAHSFECMEVLIKWENNPNPYVRSQVKILIAVDETSWVSDEFLPMLEMTGKKPQKEGYYIDVSFMGYGEGLDYDELGADGYLPLESWTTQSD